MDKLQIVNTSPPPKPSLPNGDVEAESLPGFPQHLENLENLEKWQYLFQSWKYHGNFKF